MGRALWADISTRGNNSLYAQLFLTPAVLRDAPVFDEPTGKYLSRGNLPLTDHRGAVQAALTLTASELERIAADAGLALASARLSIATLSTLYVSAALPPLRNNRMPPAKLIGAAPGRVNCVAVRV